MKLDLLLTGLLTMWVATAAQATTLKLAPDMDLLVLDGHKISGSLLKGADGIELERGQHQVLFRVDKNIDASPWVSPPLIVTFTASTKTIAITLPALHTLQQARAFARHPDFRLHDEQGNQVESQHDRLATNVSINFEQAMAAYNMQGHPASVPRFAQPHTTGNMADHSTLDFADNAYPASRILQLWYQQVDSATRQRLVLIIKALRTG